MKLQPQPGRVGFAIALVAVLCIVPSLIGKVTVAPQGTPSPTMPFPTLYDTATAPPPTLTLTNTPMPLPTKTPTPIPTPTQIVVPGQIRSLGQLVTVEQDLQVYLTYETKPNWWPFSFWTNKIILFAVGTVQAGIDLDKMNDEDLIVNGKAVEVTLPPPELLGQPNLDLNKTQVLEGSSFNPIQVDWNEMIKAQQEARDEMCKWAIEHRVPDIARKNAEMRIELLLRRLGATQVTIRWRDFEK